MITIARRIAQKCDIAHILLCCIAAAPAFGEVTLTEDTQITLQQGTVTLGTYPSWDKCREEALKRTQGAQTTTTYSCGGEKRVVIATPPCPPQPPVEARTVTCPVGTTGTWTQTRAYASAPPPACWTAGEWLPATAPQGVCAVPPGNTIFADGFESGNPFDTSKWDDSGTAGATRTRSTNRREGNFSLCQSITRTNPAVQFRAEVVPLVDRSKRTKYGELSKWKFSVFYPLSNIDDPEWEIIAQWHQPLEAGDDEGLNPPLSFHVISGNLLIDRKWNSTQPTKRVAQKSQSYPVGRMPKGRWVDFEVHVLWNHTAPGLLKVWKSCPLNPTADCLATPEQILNIVGSIGYNDAVTPGQKLGLYKSKREITPGTQVRSICHDAVRWTD